MPENASRRGAADMGMPLMILAFIVMGGFIWWLKGQSDAEFEARAIAEAEAAAAAAEEAAREAYVQLGEVTSIGTDADAFVGEEIRAEGYEVASLLGTAGFWVTTASGNPFLVVYSEELRAQGVTVQQSDLVDVVGEMLRMEVSFLDEWEAEGTISAGDRVIAEFATHFVVAEDITVTGQAGSDAGDEGAGG